MGEVNSSSFEFYEGLRILVPGGLAVGLYAAIAETFGLGGTATLGTALVAILAAFAVGFVLYFLDVPSNAAVHAYLAPVTFLKSWRDVRPAGRTSHVSVYYEILDVKMPAGLRNRVHYFGAMYRIGYEGVYLAAAADPVLLITILFPAVGDPRDASTTKIRSIFIAAVVIHLAIPAAALIRRCLNKRGERDTRTGEPWNLTNEIFAEIPPSDLVVLALALDALVVHLIFGWRWAGVVCVALPAILWGVRSHFGLAPTRKGGDRLNLHGEVSGLEFGIAATFLSVLGAVRVNESPLDGRVALGWVAATVIAAALVVVRPHEKKLLGSYRMQRNWLYRNRESVIADGYFEVVPEANGDPSPSP